MCIRDRQNSSPLITNEFSRYFDQYKYYHYSSILYVATCETNLSRNNQDTRFGIIWISQFDCLCKVGVGLSGRMYRLKYLVTFAGDWVHYKAL